ncbi:MAG: LLM class flavin-dependent oxidoreductase [Acidimicrobiia bacterium]|nr:LLM class flavin-dependent oxidoreductase [Acidimicrobiia bacterium]
MEYALQAVGADYDEFLTAAKWAEAKGLAAFAIPDHYIYGMSDDKLSAPAYDAFAIMAGLARETSSIELSITVSPVTFRHPAVLAKATATIQQMAGGRFKLGVGTGWLEAEHTNFGIDFPDTATRFEMAEEALGYLRAAFSNPPQDFSGNHYALKAFDIQPRPALRIVVGGTGKQKTPRLAGAYADEFNAYPDAPDVFAGKVARARDAARSAGRNPEDLLISSSGQVIAADTESEYKDLLAEIASKAGTDPDELERQAAMRNTPRGTWNQVRSIIAGMHERGMRRFYLQGKFDPSAIEGKLAKLG